MSHEHHYPCLTYGLYHIWKRFLIKVCPSCESMQVHNVRDNYTPDLKYECGACLHRFNKPDHWLGQRDIQTGALTLA